MRLKVINRPFDDLVRDLFMWRTGDVLQLQDAVAQAFRRNFARQGSAQGPWARLSQRTIEDRLRQGYAPGPILVRSGRYRRSWIDDPPVARTRQGNVQQFLIGSDSRLAPWHEFGTPTMPARPVAELDGPQVDRIGDTVGDILERLANR